MSLRVRPLSGLSARASRKISDGARTLQNCRDRLDQNLQVQPQRPFVDVLHVEFHPFLERHRAATIHLPEAGNSWADTETPPVPILIESRKIPHRHGPWPHKAHVALQHVEEL